MKGKQSDHIKNRKNCAAEGRGKEEKKKSRGNAVYVMMSRVTGEKRVPKKKKTGRRRWRDWHGSA